MLDAQNNPNCIGWGRWENCWAHGKGHGKVTDSTWGKFEKLKKRFFLKKIFKNYIYLKFTKNWKFQFHGKYLGKVAQSDREIYLGTEGIKDLSSEMGCWEPAMSNILWKFSIPPSRPREKGVGSPPNFLSLQTAVDQRVRLRSHMFPTTLPSLRVVFPPPAPVKLSLLCLRTKSARVSSVEMRLEVWDRRPAKRKNG